MPGDALPVPFDQCLCRMQAFRCGIGGIVYFYSGQIRDFAFLLFEREDRLFQETDPGISVSSGSKVRFYRNGQFIRILLDTSDETFD